MDRSRLRMLVLHMEWADGRLLQASAALPEEEWTRPLVCSYGSLAGTVEHIFATEWTWLQRVQGHSPATVGPPGGARARAALAASWPGVWSGWQAVLGAHDPSEPIPYRTTTGAAHTHQLVDILLHVALHSAAYRGQAVALLRQLGARPAATDLIAFLREGPPAHGPVHWAQPSADPPAAPPWDANRP